MKSVLSKIRYHAACGLIKNDQGRQIVAVVGGTYEGRGMEFWYPGEELNLIRFIAQPARGKRVEKLQFKNRNHCSKNHFTKHSCKTLKLCHQNCTKYIDISFLVCYTKFWKLLYNLHAGTLQIPTPLSSLLIEFLQMMRMTTMGCKMLN